jgi:hypothetical protein
MKRRMGIWIDHEQAILVLLKDGKATVRMLHSGVAPHPRWRGGSPGMMSAGRQVARGGGRAAGPHGALPEDRIDRKYRASLDRFYRRTVAATIGIPSILVLGPGEAKNELGKALDDADGVTERSVWIEPADELTVRQIVARVRGFFGQGSPRGRAPRATQ